MEDGRGYQVTEVLFRSDGRYQLDIRSTNPDLDYASTERGRYDTGGQTLTLTPSEYFGEPYQRRYRLAVAQQVLSLTTDYDTTQEYRLVPDSTADVLANEKVAADLVGNWVRNLVYAGTAEYTFRPGGYYVLKNTSGGSQFPPDFIRGRVSAGRAPAHIEAVQRRRGTVRTGFLRHHLDADRAPGILGQRAGIRAARRGV